MTLLRVALAILIIVVTGPSAETQPRKGQEAPEFSLQVLQGTGSGNLSELEGKVVIVEFWATYCGWCKKTHPKLAAFASKHAEQASVLAITAQNKRRVLRYLRKHETGLRVLHDPRAVVSRKYRADRTPTLVVIDQQGKIVAWAQGGGALKAIVSKARSLLAQE